MLEDRYGQALSTTSQEARDAYIAGVDSVLSGVAGYREHLAQAVAADPAFALAHVALARGLFVDAEVKSAREAVALARALAVEATPREQGHVNAIALGIDGKAAPALEATLTHLRTWPRDAMVLAPATNVFGLYGFSGLQDREERLYELLASLAPAYGEDWWFDGMHAFAACETGRLDLAGVLVERSLAAHPRNAHSAHVRAHVLYERDDVETAFAFLRDWMPALDKRSLMHCHLSWHVALSALAAGHREQAWNAYRCAVHPGGAWGPPLNVVTDSVSFLWRARLSGESAPPELWSEVHAYALRCFPKAGVAFADVHSLLACVVEGDLEKLGGFLDDIRERIRAGKYPPGEVVIWIVEGFAAYAAGNWNDAIGHFRHALPQAVRIGGSRAQLDLVACSLAAALIHADRPDEAREVMCSRPSLAPERGAASLH